MLTRRDLIAGSAASVLAGGSSFAGRRSNSRRQIVFIMVDDLLSVVYNRDRFGVRIIAPNLLRLMSEGVYFSNAFCSTALCKPSRAAIVSGRNPFKTGVHDNATTWADKIDVHSTFPGLLHAAGYRCFMYGKITHSGSGDQITNWTDSGICEEAVHRKPTSTITQDRLTSMDAIRRIRTDLMTSTEPWLLMVGFTGPHWTFGDVPELLSRYPLSQIQPPTWSGDAPPSCFLSEESQLFTDLETSGQLPAYIQGYLADITAMDRELGRLLAAIERSGLEPTIVLTSDHGFSLGDHDIVNKFTLWDEAGRAPVIVKYPGCPVGETIPETVSLLDIAPTLLHRAGIPIPNYMDGTSLLPSITQGRIRTSGAMTTMGDSETNSQHISVSFRDNRYRISRYEPCDEIELYDQIVDPTSQNNLANEPGFETLRDSMLAKLDAKLTQWKN